MKNKLRFLYKFALITLALPTYASDMQFKSGWNLVGYTGGTTINVEEILAPLQQITSQM